MTKIQELQAELHSRYPVLTGYLLPGIDPQLLRQKFDALGAHPSVELYNFYEWTLWVDFDLIYANGSTIEYALFKSFYPSPFDIDNLDENIITIGEERFWKFMQDDFGNFLVEKMHDQPQSNVPLDYAPEGLDPNYPDDAGGRYDSNGLLSAFSSLDKLIDTIIALLQAGATFYTTVNGVDALESSNAASAIGKQVNPNMRYWHG